MTRALAALSLSLAACGPAQRAHPVPMVLDAVPALFLGSWAVLGTPCRNGADGRMDIDADGVRDRGGRAAIVRIEQPAPLSVRLTLGRRARVTTLTLSAAGNVVDRDDAASYRRCLRAPDRGRSAG